MHGTIAESLPRWCPKALFDTCLSIAGQHFQHTLIKRFTLFRGGEQLRSAQWWTVASGLSKAPEVPDPGKAIDMRHGLVPGKLG